jgi:hypothetical protein
MAISFNVAFKKKVAPYGGLGGDHTALGAALNRLNKMATARGLTPLGQFVSMDPAQAAEMAGLDPEELGLPPLAWHNPVLGLAAVRALVAVLRGAPKAVPRGADVLADLEVVEQELLAAKQRKARFHFCLLD